ncbi:MAG: efflux RND transporter periplasmic adaptor subunit [Marinicella sp.]
MEKISHQPSKPSFLKRILPIIIILVVVMVILNLMASMKTEPAKIPEKPIGFLVETAKLTPSALTISIESQGTISPKRQITLTSEVSGRVMRLNQSFTAGGQFVTGDVLVTLDPADYQVAVARADANVASAQAQLDLEQAKSDQAKKDWQSFGKKGQPSALLLNIPQLDGANASLKAAKADLMKAKRDLEKTEIKAPFDGTVISKSVDIGQFVSITGPLGMIAGTDVAEVRLPLTKENITKLNLNSIDLRQNPLAVQFLDDNDNPVVNGMIQRLESSMDSRTLMTYAVAEIERPFDSGLFFNDFLQAEITGQSYNQVYAIPTAWMLPKDQVAVFSDDQTLAIKTVHVAHKTNDYFYVDQGLTTSDQIITTPIQAPLEGMQLRMNSNEARVETETTEKES